MSNGMVQVTPTGWQANKSISLLADIYAALAAKRSYKPAWPEEKVLTYIRHEKGKFFDPKLVDLFMDHIDSIRAIRQHYTTSSEAHETP